MSFVRMCGDISALATPFYSRERDRLGKEAVNQANKYLIKITKRICVLLHDIAMIHVRLDHMLADVNAVHQVASSTVWVSVFTSRRSFRPRRCFERSIATGSRQRTMCLRCDASIALALAALINGGCRCAQMLPGTESSFAMRNDAGATHCVLRSVE